MADEPIKTEYECINCHAKDSDSGNNPPAPQVLNCWKCGAGRGGRAGGMYPTVNGNLPFETETRDASELR